MRQLIAMSFVGSMLGACGPSVTADLSMCVGEDCFTGVCRSGQVRECYTGLEPTLGVGPCAAGEQKCTREGVWGTCTGQVIPTQELCTDAVDNNCNTRVDENEDADGDGFTTCGQDCCDSTECVNPQWSNPAAFDIPGNRFDDDCDGQIDSQAATCDEGIFSGTASAIDHARAMDICQDTTANELKWGLLSAHLTLPDGLGTPEPASHSVRPHFGSNVLPQGGASMVLLSSGAAAGVGDTNPSFDLPSYFGSQQSTLPADFLAANGGALPNAPGCPGAIDLVGYDPVMLTLEIRVPSNARSFSLKTNFFSTEFPEYTCSEYNDFFVVLLDSAYADDPPNPADKNLAVFDSGTGFYPVGVNLAHGNTGLFTQCVNGETGCYGSSGTIGTCQGTDQLIGTGYDAASPLYCDLDSLLGGATGWLTVRGNVIPGETIKLRIAIWDTSDQDLDSLAIVDGFQWSVESTQPGTDVD